MNKERTIRTLKGLLLSFLLHLLILLLFITNFKEITFLPPHAQDKTISLNLQQIVTPPAPKPKPVVKLPQPIVTPPIPRPIVEKKTVPEPEVQPIKKKILDESKKVFAEKSTEENNVTKIEPKPKKKIVKKEVKKKPVKKAVKKKRVVKKISKPRKRKRSNDPLANMLMGSGTSMLPAKRPSSSSGSYGARMIKQLYGKEFDTYTPTQKKFIKNNLGTIHRITQRTLSQNGYPTVAVQTKQQGTNIVSFYLHPNGDITGLRLKRRMGYEALDQNTLDVIRIAYKNYPLPNKKTKIIFHVKYTLY
jgi:TonB family protein